MAVSNGKKTAIFYREKCVIYKYTDIIKCKEDG